MYFLLLCRDLCSFTANFIYYGSSVITILILYRKVAKMASTVYKRETCFAVVPAKKCLKRLAYIARKKSTFRSSFLHADVSSCDKLKMFSLAKTMKLILCKYFETVSFAMRFRSHETAWIIAVSV